MKRKIIFSILFFSLFFSSCLIKSFNPFFHKEDVVFDDQLLGRWVDQDDNLWSFEKYKIENIQENEKKHPFYILNYREEDGGISRLLTTLFKLDDEYYLDFFPDMETISDHELLAIHTLPVHSLAKLGFTKDGQVSIRWFNEEWLSELVEKNKTQIKHEVIRYDSDEGTIVLSASTDELQQFIRKHSNDPEAFDCEDQFSGDTFCRKLTRVMD
jgi:hypothetical protein